MDDAGRRPSTYVIGKVARLIKLNGMSGGWGEGGWRRPSASGVLSPCKTLYFMVQQNQVLHGFIS